MPETTDTRRALAVVAPEGYPVPPILGGAVQMWIDALAPRLRDRAVTVVGPAHPELPRNELRDRVRHRRIRVARPLAAAAARVPRRRSWRTRAQRRLYLDRVCSVLRGFQGTLLVVNRPDFVRRLRNAAPDARLVLRLGNLHLADRAALELCDVILPCSAFVGEAVRAAAAGPDVVVMHNGVDLAATRPATPAARAAAREELGLPAGPIVLFVGRLVPEKGAHLLLDAAPALFEAHPSAAILMVGSAQFGLGSETSYEAEIARRAAELGPRVRLTGFVSPDRMAPIWAAADVFCGPSLWDEPFGRVYLESMASGVPPVGTARGGIPEVVDDGSTGLLLPREPSARQLADRLLLLAADADLRETLGRAGRARAEERFSWDHLAHVAEDVLAGLDGAGPDAPRRHAAGPPR